jgi:tRNA(Ile)-lysidine synthase
MILFALRQFFARYGTQPCHIVAAVSGGADSTALLVALKELRADGFEVTAAHVNHHLRGAESDADEAFVRDLCDRLSIELDVADGTLDPAAVKRAGIEAAARETRTRLLLEVKDRRRAPYVATAHQKNDQAETVLMFGGLRAIHPIRGDGFIRPLLEVTRDDINAFLRSRGIAARVDSSNADPRFLRNRVRARLDRAEIEKLAAQARITSIDAIKVEATEDETRFPSLPDDPVARQVLIRRHIHRLDPNARARVPRDLDSIKRISLTKSLELIRRNNVLILRNKPQPVPDYEFEIRAGETIEIPQINARFTIHVAPPLSATSPESTAEGGGATFQLPRGATPLFTIRNRRKGDRFRPLGLGGEKKLKDLLIDRKIPVEERDRIPLLLWNGEIVWVAGVEISDSFKITGEASADRYVASVHAERSEMNERHGCASTDPSLRSG